ncbi:MAG: HipA N-terminal domain-containing protein [Pseudomonadota bacterium]
MIAARRNEPEPGAAAAIVLKYGDHVIGSLRREPGEASPVSLWYDEAWRRAPGAFGLSAALPLRAEPHRGGAVRAWAEGQAPFGPARRAALGALSPPGARLHDDLFALLSQLGGDAPGAVRLAGSPESRLPRPGYRRLASLEAALASLETAPFLLGAAAGLSHTLSVDEPHQTPVAWLDEAATETGEPALALALYGAPSTHLLWLEPAARRGWLETRLFHLALARAAGLPTVEAWVGRSDAGRRWLLTERDDRAPRDGGWIRLHRETLLQGMGLGVEGRLGVAPNAPTALEEIFRWADAALPAPTRLMLLDVFLFHALIGAAAPFAHRIAFRLAPGAGGEAALALAPLSAVDGGGPGLAGPERRFPHRIGGASRPAERFTAARWRRFAERADLNPTFLLARLRRLGVAIQAEAPKVAEALAEQPSVESALIRYAARSAAAAAARALDRLDGADRSERAED